MDRTRNLELIKLVEQHECLWNHKHMDYFEKPRVEHAWKQISEELNEAVGKIQLRWKTIRCMYGNNLYPSKRKNKNKPYYLAAYLEFLRPYIKSCCRSKQCDELNKKGKTHTKKKSKEVVVKPIIIESSDGEEVVDKDNKVYCLENDNTNPTGPKKPNANMMFLQSLLPFVDDMTKYQTIRFRLKVLTMIDTILD